VIRARLAWLAVIGAYACLTPRPAAASTIDSNLACALLGCAAVWNSTDGEIYLLIGAAGGEAFRWLSLGAGPPTRTVSTGSTTPFTIPGFGHGRRLGIDTSGDGVPELTGVDGDGDGYLDASDSFPAFAVNATTRLVLASRVRTSSVWACANRAFALYAQATPVAGAGPLAGNMPLSSVAYRISVQTSGIDAGFPYGGAATSAGFARNAAVDDLGDAAGARVRVASFGSTVAAPDPDLADHCIRVDHRYDLPQYDLSQGAGNYRADVSFFVHRP
jgi:hypothetical protein